MKSIMELRKGNKKSLSRTQRNSEGDRVRENESVKRVTFATKYTRRVRHLSSHIVQLDLTSLFADFWCKLLFGVTRSSCYQILGILVIVSATATAATAERIRWWYWRCWFDVLHSCMIVLLTLCLLPEFLLNVNFCVLLLIGFVLLVIATSEHFNNFLEMFYIFFLS